MFPQTSVHQKKRNFPPSHFHVYCCRLLQRAAGVFDSLPPSDCLVPLVWQVFKDAFAASKWEATARLDFLWRLQAQQEVEDMRELREHNECLLYNILPVHVARHFLDRSKNDEVNRNLC